jgi:hypothetical protein
MKTIKAIGLVFLRIAKWSVIVLFSINLGYWIGTGIFYLTLWLGMIPYFEKFFEWVVF